MTMKDREIVAWIVLAALGVLVLAWLAGASAGYHGWSWMVGMMGLWMAAPVALAVLVLVLLLAPSSRSPRT